MMKQNKYIWGGRFIALLILALSFFIEIDYVSKILFFTGLVLLLVLLRKNFVAKIKAASLSNNIDGVITMTTILGCFGFIVLSNESIQQKVIVGVLLLFFILLRFQSSKNNHNQQS